MTISHQKLNMSNAVLLTSYTRSKGVGLGFN